MLSNLLFSVIIPTFNRAYFLDRALNSLQMQTFKDFEVIVCDDGSTDNSKEIAQKYSSTLNIKYIWNENWGGPAKPRNIGIQNSSAEWVCFLDSDDWWYEKKLETVAKYTNDHDFIFHDLDISHSKSNEISKYKSFDCKKDYFFGLMYYDNFISTSSVCVKKDFVIRSGCFSEDKSIIATEDYDLWLNIARLTDRFFKLNESLGAYEVESFENIDSYDIKLINRIDLIFEKNINHLNDVKKDMVLGRYAYKKSNIYKSLNMLEKSINELCIAFLKERNLMFRIKLLLKFLQIYMLKLKRQ